MADLFLVVDAGGSQTKVIYQTPTDDAPKFFLMPPEVECISQAQFDRYQERIGWLGSPSPVQQAWFSVADQLWVVGEFAAEFDAQDRLHEKKYENALYKVLAAVGVIVEKLGWTRRKVALHLAILLPWQEFNDRGAFESQLRALLPEFAFRGKGLKLALRTFLCRPEGGGLAATRMRQEGLAWFQEQRLVVLLFGHRNTSALLFERGQFKRGDSPLLGFSVMLDLLMARCSVMDKGALLRALVKAMDEARGAHERHERTLAQARAGYGSEAMCDPDSLRLRRYPNWGQQREIERLVMVRDTDLREAELAALDEAIGAALDEYWERLATWLERVLPEDIDEVVVSGGAALLLAPKLAAFFSRQNRACPFEGALVWDGGLRRTMEAVFGGRLNKDRGNYARFADAYGLFDQLLAAEAGQ